MRRIYSKEKSHFGSLHKPSLAPRCHIWFCSFREDPQMFCLSLPLAKQPEGSVGGRGRCGGSAVITSFSVSCLLSSSPFRDTCWLWAQSFPRVLLSALPPRWLPGSSFLRLSVSSVSTSPFPALFSRDLLKSLVHSKFSSSKLFDLVEFFCFIFWRFHFTRVSRGTTRLPTILKWKRH